MREGYCILYVSQTRRGPEGRNKPSSSQTLARLPRKVFEDLRPVMKGVFNILGDEDCCRRRCKEELPEPDWAGVIVTGSPASTEDSEAWIVRVRIFSARAAVTGGFPLGVVFCCAIGGASFGEQGGNMLSRLGIGMVELTLPDDGKSDPLVSDGGRHLPAQMSMARRRHWDFLSGALPRAERSTRAASVLPAARRHLGTQFHPEFTPTIVAN